MQEEYANESEEAGCIEIVHDHSKERRPDLKQFIVDLTCAGGSGVPLALTVSSGNQADQAVFGERLKAVAQNFALDGVLVADSALYSQENLRILGSLRWLTRVPLTLAAARQLVTELPDSALKKSPRPGYRLASVGSEYGGVRRLWVVIVGCCRLRGASWWCAVAGQRLSKCSVKASKDHPSSGSPAH